MPDQGGARTALQLVAGNKPGRADGGSRAVALTLGALLTSCALLTPEPAPVSNPPAQPVQPAEVAPPRPVPPPEPAPVEKIVTHNDQVILLPRADGSVGAVVVRQDGVEITLDKAYASAVIEGPGQIRQLIVDPSTARETFAVSLAALPPKPASFMLYFLKGKDELTADSKKEVQKVLVELTRRPAAEISVIGHTDTVGSVQFNDNLSVQRAKRVRQLLMTRGIPPESIALAGRGERELLIPTPDNVQEPRNRRVEIGIR
jgi:outer membrane protein OmpA-like peptidoglycan-associated protein